ncbi:MAG: hypothetical protein ACP5P3_06750 [Ignavibacteria bacterium]
MNVKKQILRFFSKVLIIIVLVYVLDFVLGAIIENGFKRQKAGKFAKIEYLLHFANDEILLIGSSRTDKNYDSRVFESELGMSCYNGGIPGQGIIFLDAITSSILERYQPEIIVFNLDPNILIKSNYNYERLSELLPFYNDSKYIQHAIQLKSPFEKYKTISKLYRFNSQPINIVKNVLKSELQYKGFRPFYEQLSPEFVAAERLNPFELIKEEVLINATIDSVCIKSFEHLLQNFNNKETRLFIVLSPEFMNRDYSINKSFNIAVSIIRKYNLPLVDCSILPDFIGHYELFRDYDHLNYLGAEKFSKLVCDKIKQFRYK